MYIQFIDDNISLYNFGALDTNFCGSIALWYAA